MRNGEKFDFENLEVYQRAVVFTDSMFTFCEAMPQRLQSSLGDQLRRASLSVCNNIAEGSDKESKKEKVVYYRHALHSMRECVPGLAVAFRQKQIDESRLSSFREECFIVCRMLKRLIQSVGA